MFVLFVAEGVGYLCQLAKWQLVYLISSDTSDEGTLGDAVDSVLSTTTNITIARYTNKVAVNPTSQAIKDILTTVKQEARSMSNLEIASVDSSSSS